MKTLRALSQTVRSSGLPRTSSLRWFMNDPSQDQNIIRWGLLSAGKISSDYCRAVQSTTTHKVWAVAAREGERARQFAASHGVECWYGSYDELLSDPMVDVVYIGSIADHHADLATRCVQSGKPVVVEKPLTLSWSDTDQLLNLAGEKQVFVLEGMWTRFFPATRHVRHLVESGAIGRPLVVQADFGWSTRSCPPTHRVWYPHSGGMILDIGMYMAQWGQVAFGNEAHVDQIQAMGTRQQGIDMNVLASCQYTYSPLAAQRSRDENPDEVARGFLQFYLTGEAFTEERVVIQGTTGRIVVDPPSHIPQRVQWQQDAAQRSSSSFTSTTESWAFAGPAEPSDPPAVPWNYPGSVGFTYQIEQVGEALRQGWCQCPDYTWENSRQVAAILDELRRQI